MGEQFPLAADDRRARIRGGRHPPVRGQGLRVVWSAYTTRPAPDRRIAAYRLAELEVVFEPRPLEFKAYVYQGFKAMGQWGHGQTLLLL